MALKNIAIGLGGIAVVVAAVGAVAAGLDWDPRDVDAAEKYRSHERARAERYRAEVAGNALPEVAAGGSARAERGSDRDANRQDRRDAREQRQGAVRDWWNEAVDGIDSDRVGAWAENLGAWWRDRAGPAWEEWARQQDERVAEPEHWAPADERSEWAEPEGWADEYGDPLGDAAPVAPAPRAEEAERDSVRSERRPAADWWAEERERMRQRN